MKRSVIFRSGFSVSSAFTLIEVCLASLAAALILVSVYAVFHRAIAIRDSDTHRLSDLRVRERAVTVIRNDLRNALVSGGIFASLVEGDSTSSGTTGSAYPGYFKFTTTTGRDTDDHLYGDVQQVEYYIGSATGTSGANGGGVLTRSVTRDLLDTVNTQADTQALLAGVTSLQISFYDGANWQTSWNFNSADTSGSSSTSSASTSGSGSLPEAVRVDIQQAGTQPQASGVASPAPAPAPIEILVPWTTQPFASPSPSTSST